MNIVDLMPKAATGEYLDRIGELNAASRIAYGSDWQVKPNDNCYWDDDLGLWMEDDITFRSRVKKEISK